MVLWVACVQFSHLTLENFWAPCYELGSFPGVESSRGVVVTNHPLLAPRSRMSRAIPLLSL
jgi:hypothetical protein